MIVARHLRIALGSYVALLALMLAFLLRNTTQTLHADRAASEIAHMLRGVAPLPAATTVSELEQQEMATRVLREASQLAVAAEFERAEHAARSARITAWVLALGAALVGTALWLLLARADELEKMKRELVSNVSHDLKSPLSSIQEVNAAILDGVAGPLVESQKRLLTANQDSARRLASMVGKLLELARLESRPMPRRDMVDVAALARGAVTRARALMRLNQEVVVAIDGDASGTFVRGDHEDLERVLDNLLENALKFSPPSSVVRVSIQSSQREVVVRVTDEGPGVRDAEKQRVFERFYQTDVGRATRSRGLGLGLTICKSIVAEHGGSIAVADNVPRGAAFTVTLPRARGALVAAGIAETAGSHLAGAGSRTS